MKRFNLNRRGFLNTMSASAMTAALPGRAPALPRGWNDAWQAWKSAFLTDEGRVVDTLQDRASHSEGQGWGMLLAVAFDDAPTFSRMVGWSETHLSVRRDPLLAWRWRPDGGVTDYNNATDGDVFYGWSLLLGSRRFGDPRHAERAAAMAGAIDRILVREGPQGRLLLRPAAERFSAPGAETINPSYYMPLAMHALAAAFDLPRLARASDEGEALIAGLARDGLVPDWVTITADGPAPPPDLSATYSYDALRVPLYLVWSGRFAHPAVLRVRDLLDAGVVGGVPVAVDRAGNVVERSDAAGYRALARLVTCTGRPAPRGPFPPFDPDQPYYPATLHLLAAVAAGEAAPQCLP